MRLLLDEMFAGLKEYLKVLGWEVLTAQEAGLQGSEDKDIAKYAAKQDLILLTQDRKSAELAELEGARNVYISNAVIARIVDAEIRKRYPDAEPDGS